MLLVVLVLDIDPVGLGWMWGLLHAYGYSFIEFIFVSVCSLSGYDRRHLRSEHTKEIPIIVIPCDLLHHWKRALLVVHASPRP
jgi:hypothetical protein